MCLAQGLKYSKYFTNMGSSDICDPKKKFGIT